MSVNKVILVGHLGAEPELRVTSSGTPVCNMRLATNHSFTDKDGNRQEQTSWHRVVTWGKQGETCHAHLSKGRQVYIEGRIQNRSWDDKDGNKRYTTEVVSHQVVFLGGRTGGGGPPPPPSSLPAPPPSREPDDDIPF